MAEAPMTARQLTDLNNFFNWQQRRIRGVLARKPATVQRSVGAPSCWDGLVDDMLNRAELLIERRR